MSHSHVWHDSFIRVTWLNQTTRMCAGACTATNAPKSNTWVKLHLMYSTKKKMCHEPAANAPKSNTSESVSNRICVSQYQIEFEWVKLHLMYSTKSKICRNLQQMRPNLIRVGQYQIEYVWVNIKSNMCESISNRICVSQYQIEYEWVGLHLMHSTKSKVCRCLQQRLWRTLIRCNPTHSFTDSQIFDFGANRISVILESSLAL